jgi:hypothetical protein
MIDLIPSDWRPALADAVAQPSFGRLVDFVALERTRTDRRSFRPRT